MALLFFLNVEILKMRKNSLSLRNALSNNNFVYIYFKKRCSLSPSFRQKWKVFRENKGNFNF